MRKTFTRFISVFLCACLSLSSTPYAYANPIAETGSVDYSPEGQSLGSANLERDYESLTEEARQAALAIAEDMQSNQKRSISPQSDTSEQSAEILSEEQEAAVLVAVEERAARAIAIQEEILAPPAQLEKSDRSQVRTLDAARAIPQSVTGSGTQADPYILSTAEELSIMANDTVLGLTSFYRLGADIDLAGVTWVPIGSSETPFLGTLDGSGYSIKNLSVALSETWVGFFGFAKTATIRNIKFTGANVYGSARVAVVAGQATQCTLTDVSLEGCMVSGAWIIGGMVGITDTTNFDGCTNDGIVVNTGEYTGGIVGFMSDGRIDNAVFSGSVEGADHTGGIIGVQYGNAYTCTNTGDVLGTTSVGGISGELSFVNRVRYAQDCYNAGNVEGVAEVGGIAGYALSTSGASSFSAYVRGNANSGCVYARDSFAGGIIGDMSCNAVVLSCYNTGTICAVTSYAGGIVGRFNSTTANFSGTSDLYNVGSVMETYRAGSLFGLNFALSTVRAYYTTNQASGYQVPGVGARGVYISQTITPLSSAQMKELASSLSATWYTLDADIINSGYPILIYVNYLERTATTQIDLPRPEDTASTTADKGFWADPVNAFNGAQTANHRFLDQSATAPFTLDIAYDSSRLAPGELGRGWYHNYEMKVQATEGGLRYFSSPSAYLDFAPSEQTGVFVCSAPGKEQWVLIQADTEYVLTCGTNGRFFFDASGQLSKIESKTGDVLVVTQPDCYYR